jgi:hypothetical protein
MTTMPKDSVFEDAFSVCRENWGKTVFGNAKMFPTIVNLSGLSFSEIVKMDILPTETANICKLGYEFCKSAIKRIFLYKSSH